MLLPTIQQKHIPRGTQVLVRTALNVPIENGEVISMFRLYNALPTIKFLKERGARITLISHLSDETASLAPVHQMLNKFIPVSFIPHLTGEAPFAARQRLQPGEVLLLENTRHDKREKQNDSLFAEELAANADMFVFDDFTAAHREHTSTTGVMEYLPPYAGIRFYEEVTALLRITERLERPAVAVLGGAKCETKIPLIAELVETYDTIFVSGVIANTLLKHRGHNIGNSRVEDVKIPKEVAEANNIILPQEVIVTKDFMKTRMVPLEKVEEDDTIVDVGDQVLKIMQYHFEKAKTIVMNGPTSWYEKGFTKQTVLITEMVRQSNAYSFLGGGDIVGLLEQRDMLKGLMFVSTGGGSLLEYLASGTLPVLRAFEKKIQDRQMLGEMIQETNHI